MSGGLVNNGVRLSTEDIRRLAAALKYKREATLARKKPQNLQEKFPQAREDMPRKASNRLNAMKPEETYADEIEQRGYLSIESRIALAKVLREESEGKVTRATSKTIVPNKNGLHKVLYITRKQSEGIMEAREKLFELADHLGIQRVRRLFSLPFWYPFNARQVLGEIRATVNALIEEISNRIRKRPEFNEEYFDRKGKTILANTVKDFAELTKSNLDHQQRRSVTKPRRNTFYDELTAKMLFFRSIFLRYLSLVAEIPEDSSANGIYLKSLDMHEKLSPLSLRTSPSMRLVETINQTFEDISSSPFYARAKDIFTSDDDYQIDAKKLFDLPKLSEAS